MRTDDQSRQLFDAWAQTYADDVDGIGKLGRHLLVAALGQKAEQPARNTEKACYGPCNDHGGT